MTEQAVLVVREEEDDAGEILWTIYAQTHDRNLLDVLAETLQLELRIVVAK